MLNLKTMGMSALLLLTLLLNSGCCSKTESFAFGCVDDCTPQFVPKIEYIKHDIPRGLLECPTMPGVPVEAEKQSQVAGYIVELWRTADECKRSLAQVKDLVDQNRSE